MGIDDNLLRWTLDLQLYFDQALVVEVAAKFKIVQRYLVIDRFDTGETNQWRMETVKGLNYLSGRMSRSADDSMLDRYR